MGGLPLNAASGNIRRQVQESLEVFAHELRNSLAAISSSAQLLQIHPHPRPGLDDVGNLLARQVAVAQGLLDELLEVSRNGAASSELRLRRLDLCQAVRNAVEDHRGEIRRIGLQCELALPADPVWIDGDELKLAQVLNNLLRNAMKFTPSPGTISIRVDRGAGEVTLSVRDTGIGIDAALLATIYQRYRQGDRSHGGLGLGLPIVKRLVEMHAGSIDITSAGPGTGSEVIVHLPDLDHDRAIEG